MKDNKEIKVCVLAGGISEEAAVSIRGGKKIIAALKHKGFGAFIYNFNNDLEKFVTMVKKQKPDVFFNNLHGEFGEDGRIQSLMDFIKIPYTGSGLVQSAICMNKHFCNDILFVNGIKVPKHFIAKVSEIKIKKPFDFPFVIKPYNGGSSIGINILKNEKDLKKLKCHDYKIMCEEYIPGREFTVSVFNNKAIGITEIIVKNGFYDYENKYNNSETQHIINPDLTKNQKSNLKDIAESAYKILGLTGLARADFRYDGKKFYFLEFNTQPGMTDVSLTPEQFSANGINFNEMCEMLVYDVINKYKN